MTLPLPLLLIAAMCIVACAFFIGTEFPELRPPWRRRPGADCAAGTEMVNPDRPAWARPCHNPARRSLNILAANDGPVTKVIHLCHEHMTDLHDQGLAR